MADVIDMQTFKNDKGETTAAVAEVKTIILINGMEIVGKILAENDKIVRVGNPVRFDVQINDKQVGFAPGPMSFAIDREAAVDINKAVIVTVAKTLQGLESIYREMTSGIVLPSSGQVIL